MTRCLQHLYEFGPFLLDTAERRLLRDGEPVQLTPKAFETLVALVERKGKLVEREALLRVVWPDTTVEEGNLTNNVSTLRKILGEGQDGLGYIETVPRIGYRFTSPVRELTSEVLVLERHSLTRIVTEDEEAAGKEDDGARAGFAGEALEARVAQPVGVPADAKGMARGVGELDAGRPPRLLTRRWKPWLLFTVLGLSLAAGVGLYARRYFAPPEGGRVESIAVLPFRNEGGNPEVEYLSDGVSETLINSLSQLPRLKVIARSSAFGYKGKDVSPQEAAAALGVQTILLGRVAQHGESLVVSVELVDARDGTQVWGERYTRKMADLQAVEAEIARAISEKLRARLSGAEQRKMAKNRTEDPEAHRLYLLGRYSYFKLTQPEIRKSISFYQRAIELDPTYALAYAGLADAYRTLPIGGYVPSREGFPQAKAAALRALEIDGDSAEAHTVLGWIEFWYEWDWAAAEGELRRAIELSPNSVDAHRAYAHLLSNTGRHVEAIAEARLARELDPLSLITNTLEGQFLLYAGRYDEALVRLRKTLELDPNFWVAHNCLGRLYIARGMFPEAIASLSRARELSSHSPEPVAQLGYALAKAGKREEARATLEELRAVAAETYIPAYNFAMIYNGLGEKEKALEQLEKSFGDREVQLTFVNVDARWDWLRADPRFADPLRRMGFAR